MDGGGYVKSERVLNPLESAARRGKNFLGSLVGALIGLLLFFLVAPGLIFMSEFQYKAENFVKATPASLNSPATGYVYLYGKPELTSSNPCMILTDKQCAYYSYTKEKYVEKTGVKCGKDAEKPGVAKISSAPEECRTETVRSGGRDVEQTVCEKCWNAKWMEWDVVDTKKSTPEFKLGVNTITPNAKTEYKKALSHSTGEYAVEDAKYREEIQYMDAARDVLAVAQASNGVMASGEPFVISTQNFEATKEQIKQEQSSFTLMLKIGGFLAFLIGLMLILSPIKAFIDFFGSIPYLGDVFLGLGGLAGIMMFGVSLVVAVVLTVGYTILFKLLRMFVDNLVMAVILGIIFGVIALVVAGKASKKLRK